MTADLNPPPGDRATLPLAQVATEVSLVVSFWAAFGEPPALYGWGAAAAVASLLAVLFWHPYRILGAVPLGFTAAFGGALAAAVWGWCAVSGAVVGTGL